MADKAITELVEASQVTETDLFVLQQDNTAKKLSGQTLINHLLRMIDGHGGITGYTKVSTSGLQDTYRFTFADESVFDLVVTNGRAISSIRQTSVSGLNRTYTITFNDNSTETFTVTDGRSITSFSKTGTNGLEDTYTITYNDGTSDTLKVTNGAKGDKGDNTYTHIKFASQEPTEENDSMGDIPDDWIGFYWGDSPDAPTDWRQYKWFQIKGNKGDTGEPAELTYSAVEYQDSDSGTIIPSGVWSASVPVVPQGKYLWTRITNTFNTGDPLVSYSVSRMGLDGSGSVTAVADISPDENGNVPLTASDIGALPDTGGDLTGELRMNGQPISGLNSPTANDQAANMGFVNQQMQKAAPINILTNSDWRFKDRIINQRGAAAYDAAGYAIDRWVKIYSRPNVTVNDGYLAIANNSTSDPYRLYQRLLKGILTAGTKYTAVIKIHNVGVFSAVLEAPSSGDKNSSRLNNSFYLGIGKSDDMDTFYIIVSSSTTINVDWVALYEGEYTADTIPEYQYKGHASELHECMLYFQNIRAVGSSYITPLGLGYSVSETSARCIIPFASAMRDGAACSIEKYTFSSMRVKYGTTTATVSEIAVLDFSSGPSSNGIVLNCTTSGLTESEPVVFLATGGELWISKDL